MRPSDKARGARISGIFERRAEPSARGARGGTPRTKTQSGGMQRRSNAGGLLPRAARPGAVLMLAVLLVGGRAGAAEDEGTGVMESIAESIGVADAVPVPKRRNSGPSQRLAMADDEGEDGGEDDAGFFESMADVLGISESGAVRVPKRRGSDDAAAATATATAAAPIQSGDNAAAQMLGLGKEMIAEIGLLRREFGVVDIPVEAEMLDGRRPVHLYVKAREVMAKARRVQQRFGIELLEPRPLPSGEIGEQDALLAIGDIVASLREVKTRMMIEGQIDSAAPARGATFSMVYKALGDASFLLDGLVGQGLTPRDVYQNLYTSVDLVALMSARAGAVLELDPPAVEGRKTATDVQEQLMLAIYKVVGLQLQLGMDASTVPSPSMVRLSPAENYDAANLLLAELLRLAIRLDIGNFREGRLVPADVAHRDIYALTLLANANLDRLGAALQ